MLGHFGFVLGRFETLGDIMGHLGKLKMFWEILEQVRTCCYVLGNFGGVLGIFWDVLGCFGFFEGKFGKSNYPKLSRVS